MHFFRDSFSVALFFSLALVPIRECDIELSAFRACGWQKSAAAAAAALQSRLTLAWSARREMQCSREIKERACERSVRQWCSLCCVCVLFCARLRANKIPKKEIFIFVASVRNITQNKKHFGGKRNAPVFSFFFRVFASFSRATPAHTPLLRASMLSSASSRVGTAAATSLLPIARSNTHLKSPAARLASAAHLFASKKRSFASTHDNPSSSAPVRASLCPRLVLLVCGLRSPLRVLTLFLRNYSNRRVVAS